MVDNRFHEHKNCSIMNVYKKLMGNIKNLNSYLIELSVEKEGTCFPDYFNIKVEKSNLYTELVELKNNKRERVYASHGMADIDIFFSPREKKYCIEWSPNESSYHYFYVNKESFDDMVSAFVPDEEKQY